jgi:hypothetical protein
MVHDGLTRRFVQLILAKLAIQVREQGDDAALATDMQAAIFEFVEMFGVTNVNFGRWLDTVMKRV